MFIYTIKDIVAIFCLCIIVLCGISFYIYIAYLQWKENKDKKNNLKGE